MGGVNGQHCNTYRATVSEPIPCTSLTQVTLELVYGPSVAVYGPTGGLLRPPPNFPNAPNSTFQALQTCPDTLAPHCPMAPNLNRTDRFRTHCSLWRLVQSMQEAILIPDLGIFECLCQYVSTSVLCDRARSQSVKRRANYTSNVPKGCTWARCWGGL